MKKLLFLSVGVAALFFACKKDDEKPVIIEEKKPVILAQTFEINASSTTAWKYFSLAKNDTIVVANPATSTEWDLAFQRYRIRTNSAKTGAGQGSAANTYLKGQTGFDALKLVSDTLQFATDDSLTIAVQGGYSKYLVNPTLYSWFKMESSAMSTQIVPTDNIYVVKTATGKYAKVWVKSYYGATNASGYVSFQFKYQADGSKNIE